MRFLTLGARHFHFPNRGPGRGSWRTLLAASALALAGACGGGDATPKSITAPPPITPAPPTPGLLGLTVTGLPAGTNADFLVTGSAGTNFSRTATGNVAWTDVPAGRYTITVRPVRATAGTFAGSPASITVDVAAAAAATAIVNYAPLPSALALEISGVPGGAQPIVSLTAPGGQPTPVLQSGLFTAPVQSGSTATPDTWKVTAAEITVAGTRFVPVPASLDTTVQLGDTARVAVRYGVGSGAIAVAVSGLPSGLPGDLVLIAPDNSTRALTGTTTITGLAAGRYRLVANTVAQNGLTFRPSSDTLPLDVALSLVATPATITYVAQAGRLTIAVSGLPTGTAAELTLTGPGVSRALTAGATFDSLPSGSYTLVAASLVANNERYAATPPSQTFNITTGGSQSASVAYAIAPTTVEIDVTGLPGGTNAAITLTAPNGDVSVVSGSTRVAPATAGRWRLSAQSVSASGAIFTPTPSSYDQSVAPGNVLNLPVRYAVSTGSLAIVVAGLPSGAAGAVNVTGPGNFSQSITATTTLTSLAPGSYTLTASAISSGGNVYAPSVGTQSVVVSASLVATPATVTYALNSGSIALAINGLPNGSSGNVSISGPNAFARTLTASATLTGLAPGTYTIAAQRIVVGSNDWLATPASQSLTVAASTVATPAIVTYALGTGSLALTVSGVPNGTNAAVTVTGPNAFTRTVTATTTITSLTPGNYTITAASVTSAGNSFAPSTSTQSVSVNSSAISATATVAYAQTTGSLALAVTGLLNGAAGNVTITGPGSFSQTLTGTQTLTGLTPGSYTVAAANVSITGTNWVASPPSQTVTVTTSAVAAGATVSYAQNPGALALTVTGVPNGSAAAITVTGPNSYSRAVTASTTLSNLSAGTYTISAANITASSNTYRPTPTSQTVTVGSGATATASVAYAISTGSLAVSVSGLPNGTNAAITVTGPNSYSQAVTASTTLTNLATGSYTITASTVSAVPNPYTATPGSQAVTVSGGTTAAASVSYATAAGGVNYTLSNVYLTQAIQKPDNSVRLVANRDALLRAFVTASGANTATPAVRVRVYDGATLLQTTTLNAPESSVRTTTAEGTLTSTWNTIIPAANVRTTMRVLVELDPTQAVADNDRSDNAWPLNGTPATIAVSTVPTFTVRFVPVVVGALTGNVSAGNTESFLAATRRLWPLQSVVSDVRAPFTSSATELQSGDGNGQWLTVLSEMNTLRSTDGAPSTTHYYGVVKVSYGSGIAGYGYQPGRAAIGWDYLPSGGNVAAHEWGHNFSRQHAPCGVSGDPSYPYAGGVTNFWGWNSTTNALVAPTATDVMSYCGNTWISDYNWSAVMNYRASSGFVASAVSGAVASAKIDGLLVWGRVVDGTIQLEPAFRVNAPATPAASRPTHRLDLFDDAGSTLLQLPIEASLVDHVEGREERQFAVVVPWSAALEDKLSGVRVADPRAPLRSVSRRTPFSSPAAARAAGVQALRADVEPDETVERAAGGRVRVSWRNDRYGMAMVRDAATGEIMGYVRRSGAGVVTGGRAVDVVFSDGVRSMVK